MPSIGNSGGSTPHPRPPPPRMNWVSWLHLRIRGLLPRRPGTTARLPLPRTDAASNDTSRLTLLRPVHLRAGRRRRTPLYAARLGNPHPIGTILFYPSLRPQQVEKPRLNDLAADLIRPYCLARPLPFTTPPANGSRLTTPLYAATNHHGGRRSLTSTAARPGSKTLSPTLTSRPDGCASPQPSTRRTYSPPERKCHRVRNQPLAGGAANQNPLDLRIKEHGSAAPRRLLPARPHRAAKALSSHNRLVLTLLSAAQAGCLPHPGAGIVKASTERYLPPKLRESHTPD